MSIGAGLISTWQVDSDHQKWIGYQVILGFGIGMGMQQSNLAVQTVLKHRDVPTGSALMFFWQTLGGTIFISVAQNLFLQKFTKQLDAFPPGVLNIETLLRSGATDIRDVVPPQYQAQVIQAYNYALMKGPMTLAIITACLTVIGAAGVELRSTKEQMKKKQAEDAKIEQEKDVERVAESAPTTSDGSVVKKDDLAI